MQRSRARQDAISRLKRNLDKIMEETEYILKTENAVGSPSSCEDKQLSRAVLRDRQDRMRVAPLEETTASKFEMVNVLLQILQKQEELTVEEYTINNSTFKVLVIEDTEL